MKYVIIGACAAGLSCAETIREYDKNGDITVLGAEAYFPYSRPLISYYLKGKVSASAMQLRQRQYYAKQNIHLITGAEVTRIDKQKKTVYVGRKPYAYDKLCLCTGSVPFVPAIKNADGKENVFTFLSLEDAKVLGSAAAKSKRAVVIGAGLIGMKAAEGLSKCCRSVDVVELAPRILPSILDEDAAKMVQKHIETEGGIRFHLGTSASSVKSNGKKVERVVLANGEELACDLLVIAVGVRANIALAERAGLACERGIQVKSHTGQTSDADIYAAGDCALSHDCLDNNEKVIALWCNAVKQGKIAGAHMAAGKESEKALFSVNAIDFYALRICTCGLINAEGEAYCARKLQDKEHYKRFIVCDNKLVGFVLVGDSENAGIYTSLIENKTDLSSLHGDLLAKPDLFWFDAEQRSIRLKGGVL